MAQIDNFEEFLVSGVTKINSVNLIIALCLAAILSYILSKIYVKYAKSISNKEKFAGNFVLLTTTTALIIIIVKSSLALSLGLVGALSIVRFRAAIKEPEELAFLFLCIAIGLGLGAGQIKVTLISFSVISALIIIIHFKDKTEARYNLHITISGKGISLKEITKIIKRYTKGAHLRRFDEDKINELEASYIVDIESFDHLEKLRQEIKKLSKTIDITYIDQTEI